MPIKNIKFFLLISVFCSHFSFAQQAEGEDLGSYKKNFIEGSLLLTENNKILALKYFKNALMYDSSNANINYLTGICYLELENKKKYAEKYLSRAVKNVTKNYKDSDPAERKAPVIAFMYMAKAYLYASKFSEAEDMLTLFESQMKKKDEIAKVESESIRNQIKFARIFTASPSTDLKFTHFNDSINSIYPEFSQVISLDENMIIFAARRKTNYGAYQLALDGFAVEDVLVSYKKEDGSWSSAKSISDNINSFGSELPVGLSFDGQTLLLQKEELGDANLFYSTWDGHDWTIPERFGSNINSESLELSACLSADGNLLYFSSNRDGGFGGLDIWRCVKLPNGKWSLAQNLGPTINTPLNEDCPYLTADGKVFYFSSEGHQSIGGYDCMFSVINDEGEFSKPINLGFPINSSDDDLYFQPSYDNHRLYFSSLRQGTTGERDIFMVEKKKAFPVNVSVLNGRIKNTVCDSFPSDLSIKISAPALNQQPLVLRPMRENGSFSAVLTPGAEYIFEFYQKENLILTENYVLPFENTNQVLNKYYALESKNNTCSDLVVRADASRSAEILVDLILLTNQKDRKPLSGISVNISSDGSNSTDKVTDNEGKISQLLFKSGAQFDLQFTSNSIHSEHVKVALPNEILGSKYEKIFYYDELFTNNKNIVIKDVPKKGKNKSETIPKETDKSTIEKLPTITLTVLALENRKNGKPINGATFHLSGTDGSVISAELNPEGKVGNVKLSQNVNYEFYIEKNGVQSPKQIVSTYGIAKSKSITKKIYLTENEVQVPDNSSFTGDTFKFYYKYNMNQVDAQAPEFKEFVNKITEIVSTRGSVDISIVTSSSSVPTHKYKNNKELSAKRLKKTIDILHNSLSNANIDKSKLNIVSRKAIVSGPKYSGDSRNKSKYEKYQYVIIKAK